MRNFLKINILYLLLYLVYPSVCDSQKGQQRLVQPSFPQNEMEASKLEQEYVHKVYEEIATHFSSTRHSPWPRIVEFLRSLPTGSIVADIGCGNGKYLGINEDLYMVSSDCYLFLWVLVFILSGTGRMLKVQVGIGRMLRIESYFPIQDQVLIVLSFHLYSWCALPVSLFPNHFCFVIQNTLRKIVMDAVDWKIIIDGLGFLVIGVE